MRMLKHALAVLLALFLLLGLPAVHYLDVRALRGDADAVSRATMDLPDTPSGEFLVWVNENNHRDSLEQWEAFFREADYGVLLEDVHCMVISGDLSGVQLAQRYQARLAKDQMTLRQENGVLVASRLEQGKYDLVIVSKEMAAYWQLDGTLPDDAARFVVRGDEP